ncbi:MAG: hypothetical protein AAF570_18585, partial [Bacteroidota bacterium]
MPARTDYPSAPIQAFSDNLKKLNGDEIKNWRPQQIRAIAGADLASLTRADFEAMTFQQLAAFTHAQHQGFTDDQVRWFNESNNPIFQPEVKAGRQASEARNLPIHGEDTPVSFPRDDDDPSFYQEAQVQGWCGKHALNGFLGAGIYSTNDIWKLAVEYGGDEKKASNYVTRESKAKDKIGDVSTDLILWILKAKHQILVD